MKLLYLPIDVLGNEQDGMRRGFDEVLGPGNLYYFDYLSYRRAARDHVPGHPATNNEFLRITQEFQPQWIHLQAQQTEIISGAALRRARELAPEVIITHWMGDWRPEVHGLLREVCQEADVTFVSNEGQMALYAEAGAQRVIYWQIASDYQEFCDLSNLSDPPFQVPEVVFCGNHYPNRFPGSEERLAVVRALARADVGFGVVGGGWPKDVPVVGRTGSYKEQKHIYMKAKITVGVNNVNNCLRYYSERQISAMSVPRPHVCWAVPGLEKDFRDDVHCVFYRSPEEAVTKVRELRADPERCQRIGEAGRAEILKKHLWPERIREVLPLIESLYEKRVEERQEREANPS